MAETPFEGKLRQIARDANRARDSASVTVLVGMIACVQQGRYTAMRALLDKLKPLYRSRVGAVPSCREGDSPKNPTGGQK